MKTRITTIFRGFLTMAILGAFLIPLGCSTSGSGDTGGDTGGTGDTQENADNVAAANGLASVIETALSTVEANVIGPTQQAATNKLGSFNSLDEIACATSGTITSDATGVVTQNPDDTSTIEFTAETTANKCTQTTLFKVGGTDCQMTVEVNGSATCHMLLTGTFVGNDFKLKEAPFDCKTTKVCSGLTMTINQRSFTVGMNLTGEVTQTGPVVNGGTICIGGIVYQFKDLKDLQNQISRDFLFCGGNFV